MEYQIPYSWFDFGIKRFESWTFALVIPTRVLQARSLWLGGLRE